MTGQTLAEQTAAMLASPWRTEPNLDLGDVRIVADTPDGPSTVAELLLYGQPIADHITGLHNQWLAMRHVKLTPVAATVRGQRYECTPLTIRPEEVSAFMERYRSFVDGFTDANPTNDPKGQP